MFAEQAGKLFEMGDACFDGQVCPRWKGGAGCADGGFHGRCRRGVTLPHRLLRDRVL